MSRPNPNLEAALSYSGLGWPVFPIWWVGNGRCACGMTNCNHPGKHPIGKLAPNGRNSATTDSEKIKEWWGKYPKANIGIPTGQESGLVVVDFDPRNGSNESRKMLERLGNFPFTPIANTGGGGEHILLQHPGPGHYIKSKSGLGGFPGIDQKGEGGYIVAPPSNHISGGQYNWKIGLDTPLARIPKWLMQLLLKGEGSPNQEAQKQAGETIPKGKRNEKLTSLAGSMRRRGMSQEAIEAALFVENLRCEPPLPEAEVRRIAQSIGCYNPAPPSVITCSSPEKTYLPLPPPFPVSIFPASCQRAITEIHRAYGVPIEIPGCAFLGTAGGCIGRSRGLRIKQGWVEHANLWLAIVAKSGVGKSPPVREIQRPIFDLEKRWFAEYKEALEEYTMELEQRRHASKDERSEMGPPPSPPEWQQIIVDDTTTEALTDAFAANPRGILWNRDELAGLLHDLDKYAKKEGGTKARMMSAYDSGPWKVNRREASKKAFIPNATLSILGTIQPKALPTIFSALDADNGFLPRFIFVGANSEDPSLWTDDTVSATTRDYLSSIFDRLLTFHFDEQSEPIIIGVEREAKWLYKSWFNEQVLEPWQNLEATIYESVLAKLRGQCLRIALILHCLETVDAGKSDLSPVSPDTMEKAITLSNCFKAHQRNAWQTIINQGKVAELPPLQRHVVRAILSLEGEIVGGMLATAKITEQVNRNIDPRFQVSADAVGRAAASLNLTTDKLPDRSARGVKLKEQDLQKLKTLSLSQIGVPSVLSAHKSGQAKFPEEKASVPDVPDVLHQEAPAAGHSGHLPDTCDKSKIAHEYSTSDTSGTFFERKNSLRQKAACTSLPLIFTWNQLNQSEAAVRLVGGSIQDLRELDF